MSATVETTKPIRLLLVDDEQGFVDILSKRLQRRDIDVNSVLSGADAIQALRGSSFDIAVLDLKMEGMDGIAVLKVFKVMAPEMPVIILTGHGSEEAARDGLTLGAADYLMKPCDLDELIRKITHALADSRRAAG
ncbi:MAG: response regulator [Desulfovibrionales bacterium]|nr:MAG: response regulator [Desulfovibrionales bacterium]